MNSDANSLQTTNPLSANDIKSRSKQRITARSLLETKRLSDPQIHPDGQRVAFVATEADFDESHWVSHLWLTEFVPVEEGEDELEEETRKQGEEETGNPTPNTQHPTPTPLNSDDLTRQLTFSRDGEMQPRWSPDGRYLAFLSARPDETEALSDEDEDVTEQVWILPIDGGEARKVTSAREGVLDYEWAGDSSSIVYLASEPRPRPLENLRKEERNRRKVDPIVEQDDRLRRQMWRVDVEEEKPKLLLTGDYGVAEFALSPDGERLAFVTNYSGEGNDYHLADLYVRYLSVGKTVKLIARTGGKYHLRWSPDGAQLAFLSWLDPHLSYSRECVFVADVPTELPEHAPTEYGQNAPGLTDCRLLTDLDTDLSAFEWQRPVGSEGDEETEEAKIEADRDKTGRQGHIAEHKEVLETASTLPSSEASPTVLGYALAAVRTYSEIIQFTPGEPNQPAITTAFSNSEATKSSPNTEHRIPNTLPTLDDLAIDPGGRSLAYVQESANALPEIFLRDEHGQTHQLTRLNADFSENHLLPRQEVVTWASPDGVTIEGVLTLPEEGATSYPLIVQIHGGPKGRSTNTLQNYSMAPVWAAEGYAVLRPNFRGSEGYGNDFAVANRRDLGGGDFNDIMAGVDWCIAQGIADPEKLGVMGGSYGGYMTNWAIGHTNRFKAAVSMFGIFHLQTDYSNSELSRWENDYAGAYYWEDPEIYRRMSPGTFLDAIQTPTLIIHGDEDSNTFISNSKELYQALRHRGVTAQFVHYPREGHGVREPNHKMDEMRRCFAWMDKYVRNGGQNPAVYRMGEKVPSAHGLLELCVTRCDLPTFIGQPKPEKDAPNPTQLLEIVFTLSNKDTREHVPPLLLPLGTIWLEEDKETRIQGDGENSTLNPQPSTLNPIGVALDVLGGKVLIEGEHLRTTQHPDAENGQLAFGCALVYRIPKTQSAGLLYVLDFPPVQVQWRGEDDEEDKKEEA